MPDERKTVYVNDHPVKIFLWAEIQHCVNAYNSELFLKIQSGEAEIVDKNGDRIGWGGYAGDGQHIYVRMIEKETPQPVHLLNPQWVDQLIEYFKNEPVGEPPHTIWRYIYRGQIVYYVPRQSIEMYSSLYDMNGNELCSPDGGLDEGGDHRCADFFASRTDETLIWKDTRIK